MNPSSAVSSDEPLAIRESTTRHHIKNVFLIMMENHNWTGAGSYDIRGNAEAPYINKTLVPMGAHPSRYYNPPHLHPSLPNYLWLEAGTNFGILNDDSIASNSQTTTLHLVTLLKNAGISWKSYNEWANGTICPLGQWHTPFVFFDDVTNYLDADSPYCISHIRPLSELTTDLKYDKTAHYNFIVPNLCHSMHSNCGENPIKQGDTWLSEQVPKILESTAFKDGGVLFIVFDEASVGDGPIPVLILSPYAKRNFTNYTYYNHSSMLRTVEEIFGVAPIMRNASTETDLRDFFSEFP
ncbi:alkaline phosphatase family protein [Telmatobacter sp. DSM 110680]|uniref:Alkaline phosphatase family protein n=1 Tax=Telmatobacter sp. DSM 110680 TaxID=3036704 RepID=A0AAU7DN07_9BACT